MQPTYILEPISAGTSEIQVPADGRANVGREITNDFSFPHDFRMSSVHFEIGAAPGGCCIRDLASSNGLFLNAKRINTAIAVEGDEIQAGGARWHVVVRHSQIASNLPESTGSLSPSHISPEAPPPATPPARATDAQLESHAAGSELIITADDGSSRRLAGAQTLSIGRTPAAQWIFGDDEQLSSCHMKLSQQAGVWKVTDQKSSNGTFVNGARVSEAKLSSGDRIRAGQTQFDVFILESTPERPSPLPSGLTDSANPAPSAAPFDKVIAPPIRTLSGDHATRPTETPISLHTTQASLRRLADGQEFILAPNQLVSLGRSLESTISLAHDFEVSTQHATLMFDGSCIQLRDVGSANGSFVAGKRVLATELMHGDRLRVGKTEFVVCLPKTDGRVVPSPAVHPSQEKPAVAVAADFPYYSNHSVTDNPPRAPASDVEPPRPEHAPSTDVSPTPDDAAASDESGTHESDTADGIKLDEDAGDVGTVEGDADQNAATEPVFEVVPAIEPIDFGDGDSYAGRAAALRAIACRSGLFVYLGDAGALQPVDVCLTLLRATSGWVLNGSEIENWILAASQGLSGLPREWLNPSHADDASWMLPFLDNWGSGNSWLVLSHVELEDGLHSLRELRQPSEGGHPHLASITPTALADFLTGQDRSLVEPFFAPFDAILLEMGKGERWALVGRLELEAILKKSDL